MGEGQQLWPDRVKEKCRTDRSIAIAHGLEHLCEVPPPKRKKKNRKRVTATTEVTTDEGNADDEAE